MSEAATEGPYVRFRASGELYGLPMGEVQEVVAPGPASPIPRAPPCAVGVVNHHGRLLTLVDLGSLTQDDPPTDPPLMVILSDPQRKLALGADAVEGIGPLEVSEGVAKLAGRAVTVLSRSGVFEMVDLAFGSPHVLDSSQETGGERS